MRKMIAIFLLIPNMAFGAKAIVSRIESIEGYTDAPAPIAIRWSVKVAYEGVDVPGTILQTQLQVAVSTSATAAAVSSAIVAAVQSAATANGFSVTAGNTLMPTYSFQ